jgi:hypothetical protein
MLVQVNVFGSFPWIQIQLHRSIFLVAAEFVFKINMRLHDEFHYQIDWIAVKKRSCKEFDYLI